MLIMIGIVLVIFLPCIFATFKKTTVLWGLLRFAKVLSELWEIIFFFLECKWDKLARTISVIVRLYVLGQFGRDSVYQFFFHFFH